MRNDPGFLALEKKNYLQMASAIVELVGVEDEEKGVRDGGGKGGQQQ